MTQVRRRGAWVLVWVLASVSGVMTLGGAAGVAWWWGVGFDEAEALGMATPSTDAAMVASFWVAVAGVAGLIATGVVAAVLLARRDFGYQAARPLMPQGARGLAYAASTSAGTMSRGAGPDVLIGSWVEYVGDDIPEVHLWRGHPGMVEDKPPGEVMACMVGGPTMCFGPADLRALDGASYRQRGGRVISGMHPVEDREIGNPITADGSHWP